MTTERIYYQDSHAVEFEARVLACEARKEGFRVALDRTCFFPEGGGQSGDRGVLLPAGAEEKDAVAVEDTHEQDGLVWHYTRQPLEPGTAVWGRIDWELRFARMQCHTGEHIVSGLFHTLNGLNNVGFHLGDQEMTIDLSGPVTWEDVKRVQRLANGAVAEDLPVRCEFPAAEELAHLEYRSKLDLTENVRIVTIPGYDVCACCAPHVKQTGEIGLIHVLSSQNWKGGVRLRVLCGSRAVEDLMEKQVLLTAISGQLSVPQSGTAQAVERLSGALSQAKYDYSTLGKRFAKALAGTLPAGQAALVIEELDPDGLRALVNEALARGIPLCAAFAPAGERYTYIVGSSDTDLRPWVKEMNGALSGRGGGKPGMVQGSVAADADSIRHWWSTLSH